MPDRTIIFTSEPPSDVRVTLGLTANDLRLPDLALDYRAGVYHWEARTPIPGAYLGDFAGRLREIHSRLEGCAELASWDEEFALRAEMARAGGTYRAVISGRSGFHTPEEETVARFEFAGLRVNYTTLPSVARQIEDFLREFGIDLSSPWGERG